MEADPVLSPRESLLRLLRKGAWTVPDLAGELGISGTAVRKHLDQLRLEGLVDETGLRRGRGRPAILYGLSEEGEAVFRRDRGEILETVLAAVHSRHGDEGARALLRDAGGRLAHRMLAEEERHGRPLAGDDPADRALYMLHRLGGRETVRHTGRSTEILGFTCPLAEYVDEYPEACHFVAGFTEEVMGRSVRPCCSRGAGERDPGDSVCLLEAATEQETGAPPG